MHATRAACVGSVRCFASSRRGSSASSTTCSTRRQVAKSPSTWGAMDLRRHARIRRGGLFVSRAPGWRRVRVPSRGGASPRRGRPRGRRAHRVQSSRQRLQVSSARRCANRARRTARRRSLHRDGSRQRTRHRGGRLRAHLRGVLPRSLRRLCEERRWASGFQSLAGSRVRCEETYQ